MKVTGNFWSWIFADCKSDYVIIWGSGVTSELSSMMFETKDIWTVHSSEPTQWPHDPRLISRTPYECNFYG